MRWLERILYSLPGAIVASAAFWWLGSFNVSGDFAANVTGAAIGGMISVGLSVLIYQQERKIAVGDAETLAARQRAEAIREALRYIRAIRECVIGAVRITINSGERITNSLILASDLAVRAWIDPTLTDFPLRLAMEDSVAIGRGLTDVVNHSGLTEGNEVPSGAGPICVSALRRLDNLMDDYRRLRALPSL